VSVDHATPANNVPLKTRSRRAPERSRTRYFFPWGLHRFSRDITAGAKRSKRSHVFLDVFFVFGTVFATRAKDINVCTILSLIWKNSLYSIACDDFGRYLYMPGCLFCFVEGLPVILVIDRDGRRLCYDKRFREHAPFGSCSNCVQVFRYLANARKSARRYRATVVHIPGDTRTSVNSAGDVEIRFPQGNGFENVETRPLHMFAVIDQ